MISALYILHRPDSSLPFSQNDLLLYRGYHNDVPNFDIILGAFCKTYHKKLPEEKSPFLLIEGISYIYVTGKYDIVLLAVSRQNANAMSTVVFLNNIYKLLHLYLTTAKVPVAGSTGQTGRHTTTTAPSHDKIKGQVTHTALDRDTISDNATLIHELLDECMDFGVIQTTDYNILKEYIKVAVNRSVHAENDNQYDSSSSSDSSGEDSSHNINDAIKMYMNKKGKKKGDKKKSKAELKNIKSTHNQPVSMHDIEEKRYINSSILRTSSSAINWRPKGIFYAKNEIYIDLIENCEFYFDLGSEVIKRNEIFGRCDVKCYLSGMPACKVEFNEKHISGIEVDDDETEHSDKNKDTEGGNILPTSDDEDDEGSTSTIGTTKGKHIPIRNIQFHQCIDLSSLYKENLVKFTPPDDKFTLLTYHVEQQKQIRKLPLIKITPVYKLNQKSKTLQIMCTLSTQFKKRLKTQNLLVKIPVDPTLFPIDNKENLKFKAQLGEVTFKVDSSQLYWQIGEIKGGTKDVKMMAELQLITNPSINTVENVINRKVKDEKDHSKARELRTNLEEEDANGGRPTAEHDDFDHDHEHHSDDDNDNDNETDRGISELDSYYGVNKTANRVESVQSKFISSKLDEPFDNDIYVSFVIPMLSYSGLKLTFLKVEEDQMKYTSFPWVRYSTETGMQNSTYRFRLGVNCFSLC
ncbi:adaptin medium chain homolog Apm2p [[Candida] railenensis]|uniref:Adaptin medium chain homolog Apm2p n=1 Tax=[Candida] railenensis TaxID=45579 RepID=A0A9P0QMX4_9ASCO|nr:adaptin medium chain homolog Apm2p [[Candida] railenensis]